MKNLDPSDEEMLERFERAAFNYFLEHANDENGLIADKSTPGAPASIAAVGFGLSGYPIGVERGWLTRDAAARRTLATLQFFWNSEQSEDPFATGYKGFFYHFLDMKSGKRVWQSELSMIDTALLLAGILVAGAYFDQDDASEKEIRHLADAIYTRVDWQWARGEQVTLRQGWKPEAGFLHYGWDGYSEAIILYVLGLASPSHPITGDCYTGWTSTYQWENIYGQEFLYAGPLFIHHFSHAWIDFAGIQDSFMRRKNCDYFENTRRATFVQQEYARRNPYGYQGYGENCWGFSAGEGPGYKSISIDGKTRQFFGYTARGVPFGPDDGTICPSAMLSSLPFVPDITLAALRHLSSRYPQVIANYALPSGFNPTFQGIDPTGLITEGRLGLDQGIILLMIENFRSGLIWKLMRRCPTITSGLSRAGFAGGWLK
ncbi:MAG TPA: glucoamylase family protein [Aestuariivirga sp.]